MINVFIADDHTIVRRGLRQLLHEEPDIRVCGEAASTVGLEERCRLERCDVLLLDINITGGTAPGMVQSLTGQPGGPAVIIYTMYPEDSHAVGYLRAGALAFINKKRSIGELIEAIRTVVQGRRYYTSTLGQYLFEQGIDLERPPDKMFSPREREVIIRLAAGDRANRISAELGISASTVNTYVHRIKEKLGVRTVMQIVDFARANNLLG